MATHASTRAERLGRRPGPGRAIHYGDDEKTFFSEGRRQFSVCRAADAVEVLSGGSIRLSAARCIRLTGKSFGRATSYASDTREVKASSRRACRGRVFAK